MLFKTKNDSFSSLFGGLARDLRLFEKWVVWGNPYETTEGLESKVWATGRTKEELVQGAMLKSQV